MSDFDRLRPRGATPPPKAPSPNGAVPSPRGNGPRADKEGKRALFSVESAPAAPATGALKLTCSGCKAVTAISPRQAITAALPSLHLPLLRRKFPSWMRCPACKKHQWVRVDLRR